MSHYQAVRADLEADRNTILQIIARNLPARSYEEHAKKYDWYYLRSPYGPSPYWLLQEKETGQFVGGAGNGLRQMKLFDQTILVGVGADFAVDQAHRSLLPATVLQKTSCQSDGERLGLLYGFPNNKAVGAALFSGYKKIGEMTRFLKVLDPTPYLPDFLSFTGTALSWPLRFLFSLFSYERWIGSSATWVGVETASFDSRFDDLWRTASMQFPIIGERTTRFLQWRYAEITPYKIFTLVDSQEKELLGYMIYSLHEGTYVIIDLLYKSPAAFDALLATFIRFARKKGVYSLSFNFFGNQSVQETLKRFGFIERHESRSVCVYLHQGKNTEALNPSNWYLTNGDED